MRKRIDSVYVRNRLNLKDELIEINKMRKQLGLSPLKETKRKCLRCEQEFISSSYDNRMCDGCKIYTDEECLKVIK